MSELRWPRDRRHKAKASRRALRTVVIALPPSSTHGRRDAAWRRREARHRPIELKWGGDILSSKSSDISYSNIRWISHSSFRSHNNLRLPICQLFSKHFSRFSSVPSTVHLGLGLLGECVASLSCYDDAQVRVRGSFICNSFEVKALWPVGSLCWTPTRIERVLWRNKKGRREKKQACTCTWVSAAAAAAPSSAPAWSRRGAPFGRKERGESHAAISDQFYITSLTFVKCP